MKILVAFIIIVATAKTEEYCSYDPGFRVKYGYGDGIGTSFFYDTARNEKQAIANGMIKVTPPKRSEGPLSLLTMYCMDSYYYFCALYDDTGYIAGIQLGFRKDDLSAVLNFQEQGFISWISTVDGVSTEFWVTHAYFISTELLATSAESRIKERDATKILQDKGIWVTNFDGGLLFIPKNTSDIASSTPFTKQACVPWMGRHYYYNMTSETLCTADSLLPWFIVEDCGEIIGVANYVVNIINVRRQATDVYEKPNSTAVKFTVPSGPECIYEYAENPGLTVIHIYFVDKPWLIYC